MATAMTASQPQTETPGVGTIAYAPEDIVIVGVGLHCPAGDQAFALFGAVAAGMTCARSDPHMRVPTPDGQGDAPVMVARSDDLLVQEPGDRLLESLMVALDNAMAQAFRDGEDPGKCLLYIIVPALEHKRGAFIRGEAWRRRLEAQGVLPETVQIRCIPQAESATGQMLELLRQWPDQGWDTVIFAAADSLVDALTCQELARAVRIQTRVSDGVLPGEAACALVLQRKNPQADAGRGLARISALAIAGETHAGEADHRRMQGLSQAMTAAAQHGHLAMEAVDSLVLTLGTDTNAMLEWYQVETQLWPSRLTEAEQVAVALDEQEAMAAPEPQIPERLNLSLCLGEIGGASLPVALALACERLGFRYPAASSCLVTEAGDQPVRGAVLLTHLPAAQTQPST